MTIIFGTVIILGPTLQNEFEVRGLGGAVLGDYDLQLTARRVGGCSLLAMAVHNLTPRRRLGICGQPHIADRLQSFLIIRQAVKVASRFDRNETEAGSQPLMPFGGAPRTFWLGKRRQVRQDKLWPQLGARQCCFGKPSSDWCVK